MQAIETSLAEIFKTNPQILGLCRGFGWGKIEVVVKDGKPVMVTVSKEIKIT